MWNRVLITCAALGVLCGATIALAAEPVYRQVTRYNPPATPGAQECLTACVEAFDACDGDCRALYDECAVEAGQRAQTEWAEAHEAWVVLEASCNDDPDSDERCGDGERRTEPLLDSYVDRWEDRLICVADCGCGARYDECYQTCGGTIAVAGECVENCEGISGDGSEAESETGTEAVTESEAESEAVSETETVTETGTETETETGSETGPGDVALGKGKLAVACRPLLDGAVVFVDGAEVGPVPWIGTLEEGYHRVEVRAGDLASSPQLALVRPGEQTAVEVDLSPPVADEDEIFDPDARPRDPPEGDAHTALKIKPVLGIPVGATTWVQGDREDRERGTAGEMYQGLARFGIGIEVTGRRSAHIGGGLLVHAAFLGMSPNVLADVSPLLWIRIPVERGGRDVVEFAFRLGAGMTLVSSPEASELGESVDAESSSRFWFGWNVLASAGFQVNASEGVGIFLDVGWQMHTVYADAANLDVTPIVGTLGFMEHEFVASLGPVFRF